MATLLRRSTGTPGATPATPGTAVAVARRTLPVRAPAAPVTEERIEPGFTELQPGTPYVPPAQPQPQPVMQSPVQPGIPGVQDPYQRSLNQAPNATIAAALGQFQQAPDFKAALDAIVLAGGPEAFEVLEVNETPQRWEAMHALNGSYPGVLQPFWSRGHSVDQQGFRKRAWVVWQAPFVYGFIALFQTGVNHAHGASQGVKEWWFQATDHRSDTALSLAHYLSSLRMA